MDFPGELVCQPPQQLGLPILFFGIAITLRAIFSFLETSITAMRLFKLKEIARTSGSRYESLFHSLEKSPHQVLIAILITSSLLDVTCATLLTSILESIFSYFKFGEGIGYSLGVGITAMVIVLFGEILPKNFAKGKGDQIFPKMLWLTNLMYWIMSPVVMLVVKFANVLMMSIKGVPAFQEATDWVSSEQEIQFLIGYIHGKGLMEPEKTEMLQAIFELGTTPIKEIMRPSSAIVSVDINTDVRDTLKIFTKCTYTRLPVYQNNPENIVGMVHQKDIFYLLSHGEEKSLADIMRPILFIPETVKVSQLLREFRLRQMHMAIALGEDGTVSGLLTLEDVLEEIVGEISDEHEPTPQQIVPLRHGGWLVDATIPLAELGAFLNINFEETQTQTLADFVIEQLKITPKKGDGFFFKDFYFQIQQADAKQVRQVIVVLKNDLR